MGLRGIAAPPRGWPRSISTRRRYSTISPPTIICAGCRRKRAAGRSGRSSPTPAAPGRPDARHSTGIARLTPAFSVAAPLRRDLARAEDDGGSIKHRAPAARRPAHDERFASPQRTGALLQRRIIRRREAEHLPRTAIAAGLWF